MKRKLSLEKVQEDGKIIEDLFDSAAYDTILNFLANLEPNELYALSNIPKLTQLRAYLNGPGIFKSLYEIRRTKKNYAISDANSSALENDVLDLFSSADQAINYWKLWLSCWHPIYHDEIRPIVECHKGAIRIGMYPNGWEDDDYMFLITLSMNPTKMKSGWYDKLYTAQNGGLQWHPIVRRYMREIMGILSIITWTSVRPLNADQWELDDGYYQVMLFGVGYNQNLTQKFFTNPIAFPRHYLDEVHRIDSAVLEEALTLNQEDVYELTIRDKEQVGNVDMYDMENITRGWGNYIQAVCNYYFLTKDTSAFLIVSKEDFGVDLLRSCMVCEKMANFIDAEAGESFCGEECYKRKFK